MDHGANTSPKTTGNRLWRTCPAGDVEALVGDDLAGYARTFESVP